MKYQPYYYNISVSHEKKGLLHGYFLSAYDVNARGQSFQGFGGLYAATYGQTVYSGNGHQGIGFADGVLYLVEHAIAGYLHRNAAFRSRNVLGDETRINVTALAADARCTGNDCQFVIIAPEIAATCGIVIER